MGAQATLNMVTLFIFVCGKVLTVAQDITPIRGRCVVLYAGVHITVPDWCYSVRVCTITK